MIPSSRNENYSSAPLLSFSMSPAGHRLAGMPGGLAEVKKQAVDRAAASRLIKYYARHPRVPKSG